MNFLKTLFLLGLLISSIFCKLCDAVKDSHWTDFIPNRVTQNEGQIRRNARHRPPNDTHKTLNAKSQITKPFREKYIRTEIQHGHTGRKEFIPLLDQRDHHEEHVNGALITGIALRKAKKHKASQSMFQYAYEQREKSREIQRQMDHINQTGHVDRKAAIRDRIRYSRANFKDRDDTNKKYRKERKPLKDSIPLNKSYQLAEQYQERLEKKREKQKQYILERKRRRKQVPDHLHPSSESD